MKRFIQILLTVIPITAPVPAAWVVLQATMHGLAWPWYIAWIAALTIEGLGFASVNLAERMWTFNRSLRLDERAQKWSAPTWQPVAATVLYLLITVSTITLLDISQALARVLPATFPLLGVTGAALWAVHAEQQQREQAVSEYRSKKDEQRRQRRSKVASDAPSVAQRRPATLNEASSDAQRRSAKKRATLYRCECGKTFSDRFKYSGHAGRCPVHLQVKAGPAIPVDQSLLISKEQPK